MPQFTGNPNDYDTTKLNEEGLSGSCLCGAITVTLTQKNLFSRPNGHICHCANCRKFSGSPPNILRLPASNAHIHDPNKKMKTYADPNTGSGGPVPRSFCGECGCGIGVIPDESMREKGFTEAFVWLGLFPRVPTPEIELFTAHRQIWARAVEGVKQNEFLGDFLG